MSSLFPSILLSFGHSINHDNALYISNYYIINTSFFYSVKNKGRFDFQFEAVLKWDRFNWGRFDWGCFNLVMIWLEIMKIYLKSIQFHMTDLVFFISLSQYGNYIVIVCFYKDNKSWQIWTYLFLTKKGSILKTITHRTRYT